MGPLSAILLRRTDSRTLSGSGVPSFSMTSTPASTSSHSKLTPVASMHFRAAAASSGPIPSPRIRVTRRAMRRSSLQFLSAVRLLVARDDPPFLSRLVDRANRMVLVSRAQVLEDQRAILDHTLALLEPDAIDQAADHDVEDVGRRIDATEHGDAVLRLAGSDLGRAHLRDVHEFLLQ